MGFPKGILRCRATTAEGACRSAWNRIKKSCRRGHTGQRASPYTRSV